VLLLVATSAGAAETARPRTDPARLVYLLEYVGTDYAGAVDNGHVTNELEYGEVLRLTEQIIQEYGAQVGRADAVAARLHDLEQLVVVRAPSGDVWTATRRLLPEFTRSLGGAARPSNLPNLANGRRLWASDCAPCHGASGDGDGPLATDMNPSPTAFSSALANRLSPRQVYNALTFGVDGTAMPSFSAAYSEQQRWDVAFLALTLREGFEPKRSAGTEQFTLDEIAALSNFEILARLQRTNPNATVAEADYFRVNFVSPAGAPVPLAGADAEASHGVSVALQLQDVFADVAERVLPRVVGVLTYARDPAWSAERLRAEKGQAWMAANPDLVRHEGFRLVHTGSGVIVDEDGYVLSDDHLLRGDDGALLPFIEIEDAEQLRYPMTVVGTEPTIDLAVLRVADARRLPLPVQPLDFGDSDRLQIGHWLIALGDPPGPERLFRIGVVSSPPSRQCYQEQLSATSLQSSLQVPEGALGGPVVDILGHVVGLNVRPASTTNLVASGAARPDAPAFTLPINLVLNIFEALKVAQSRRSPWLGISVLELQTLHHRLGSEARSQSIPRSGVYIDDVFDPSPASRAGVRPGDFLVALGGHPIAAVGDFQTWLYVLGIGNEVRLDLLRDGQTVAVNAPIEERPESARPQ
jgi:S1-C subfamily serine protease